MKKIILTVVLIAIIVYAYDPSIETTGTEKEKNILKDLEQEHIDSELKIYRKSVEQKKAKGKTIDKTEQEVIDNAKASFNYKVKKTAEIIKKSTDDINFFGRVVNQSTNPIPNAIVPFKLSHYNIFTNLKRTKYKCYTDENGCFEITDARGLSLSFDKPIKDGYELTKNCRANYLYSYDRRPLHQPDPINPVLFIMRKVPEKALTFVVAGSDYIEIKTLNFPIYSRFFRFKDYNVDVEKVKYRVDWRTRWFKEKGYFKIGSPKFKFTAFSTTDTNVYKITFELVPDGEFARCSEKTQKIINQVISDRWFPSTLKKEIATEAPETGYQSEMSVIFTNNMKKTLKSLYFFKVQATENQTLYGKLIFKIRSKKNKTRPYIYISQECYLNVEGTRNLLYDSNLECFEKERIEKGETKALELMEVRKNRSSKEKEKQKILKEYKLYK